MSTVNSNIQAQFINGIRQESDGSVWTTRKKVEIQLPEVNDSIFITISCLPYVNSHVPEQRVSLLAGDVEIEKATLKDQRFVQISSIIPSYYTRKNHHRLTICLPDAVSPRQLGINQDEQELGIYINKISVKPLGEVIDFLYEKITWAFQRLGSIKRACNEMVKDESLMVKLGNLAQYKLVQLSKIEDNDILFYEKDRLLGLVIRNEGLLNDIDTWTGNVHYLHEELLRAFNSYTTQSIKKYEPSDKILKYYKGNIFREEIVDIRANNMRMNAREIMNGCIELKSIPPYMFISIINLCNLRCKMCYQSQIKFFKHILPNDVLVKIFEYIPHSSYISISGLGEPTLAPHFHYFAWVSNHLRCHTHMITNGMLINQKQESISLVTEVAVSFDASTGESFENLRVGADFEKICSNIREFRTKYPKSVFAFSSTISRLSLPEMSGIVEQAARLGVNTVNINAIYNTPNLELQESDYPMFLKEKEKAENLAKKHEIKLFLHITDEHFKEKRPEKSRYEILEYLQGLPSLKPEPFSVEAFDQYLANNTMNIELPFEWETRNYNEPQPELDNILTYEWNPLINEQMRDLNSIPEPPKDFTTPFCLNPWNLLYVKEDGTVRLCCNSDRFMGDLNTHSIREIYNNNAFKRIRMSMLGLCEKPVECQTCKAGNRYLGKEKLN